MVYRKHRTSTTSTIETSTNVEDSVSVDNEEEKVKFYLFFILF